MRIDTVYSLMIRILWVWAQMLLPHVFSTYNLEDDMIRFLLDALV
jgi:hypothetical protein